MCFYWHFIHRHLEYCRDRPIVYETVFSIVCCILGINCILVGLAESALLKNKSRNAVARCFCHFGNCPWMASQRSGTADKCPELSPTPAVPYHFWMASWLSGSTEEAVVNDSVLGWRCVEFSAGLGHECFSDYRFYGWSCLTDRRVKNRLVNCGCTWLLKACEEFSVRSNSLARVPHSMFDQSYEPERI